MTSERTNIQHVIKGFLSSWKHCVTPANLLLTVKQYRALQAIKNMPEGTAIDIILTDVVGMFPDATQEDVTEILFSLIRKNLLSCDQVDDTFIISISESGINYLSVTPEPVTHVNTRRHDQ